MSQMQVYFNELNEYLGVDLPTLLKALLILIVGWVVARIIAAILREGLGRTELDNRIADWIWPRKEGKSVPVEQWVSRGAFYILLLFVFVGFFQALGLSAVARPLSTFLDRVFAYAPRLIAPLALIVLAWAVASVLRTIVRGLLGRIDLDARISSQTRTGEGSAVPLSQTLSEAVYWLVLLLFLPAILSPLGLTGLLEPVQHLVDELLAFLPNLLGAALILGVGWFVARVVQRIVASLLAALGTDRFGESAGLSRALGKQKLSDLLGTVVYVLILIPVLIASLDALSIDAITRPASEMLNTILQAIPNVFAAFLVIVIAYVVGGVLSGLVATLLEAVGFDFFLDRIGLSSRSRSGKSPSQIVGRLVLIVLMLFAVAEAAEFMSLNVVREMVTDFLAFGGRVVMGLIVLGLGMYLAGVARSAVLTSKASQAQLLSTAAYLAILVLAGAMALRQMGLANEIIQLAFGLTVGAVAVAVALAFGLGARDAAAQQVEEWKRQFESNTRRDS